VYYEADNVSRGDKNSENNRSLVPAYVIDNALEINISTAMQLQKLDREQRSTLGELQFYAQEQKLLTEKLLEQERMLQIVQKDITERQNLISFVFKERLESVGLGSTIIRGSNKDSMGTSVEYAALANASMS